VISDLHTGAPHVPLSKVGRVVERVNRERPDLVVLLGDYADPRVAGASEVDRSELAARLGRIEAPLGVVAVLGNHDWVDGGPAMARALREAGIAVLENSALELPRAALQLPRAALQLPHAAPHLLHAALHPPRDLWVAGLADASTRRPRLEPALDGVPPEARCCC
jgi:hypothetical protein